MTGQPARHLAFWLLSLLIVAFNAQASDFSLRLIGQYAIATGARFSDVEFGGISGLDRSHDGSYWAISDDRGGERGIPRFYKLKLEYDSHGFHGVTIIDQVPMQQADGASFSVSAHTVDPESIRVAPNGNLYWSSEGVWTAAPGTCNQPFVREMRTDGSFVREFVIPGHYNFADDSRSGGRSNKLFEALAVSPDGSLFVANEDALIQDGNITSPDRGSVIRVTAFDPETGYSKAQYAYHLPAIPMDGMASNVAADNGLSELLAISERRFIAVERAFIAGHGNVVRLVLTEIASDSSDISALSSLVDATYTPMTRKLLLEMSIEYGGIKLDNIEGISWGDFLPNGNRTLILVSDNNFSSKQITQFIAFEVLPTFSN